MSNSALLNALADALEAAGQSLRTSASLMDISCDSLDAEGQDNGDPLSRARAMHPQLGPRQAQVVSVLADHGADGTSTGVISRAINYDQPNVYLTLRGLIQSGLVVKREDTRPHNYVLAPELLGAVEKD